MIVFADMVVRNTSSCDAAPCIFFSKSACSNLCDSVQSHAYVNTCHLEYGGLVSLERILAARNFQHLQVNVLCATTICVLFVAA